MKLETFFGSLREPLFLLMMLAAPAVPAGAAPPPDPSRLARDIHATSIVLDAHNDITMAMTDNGYDLGESSTGVFHTDLARLKAGGVSAQFFAIYVPANYGTNGGAARRAMEMIDAVHREVERHPKDFLMAGSVADIRRAKSEGRIAALLGIEGGYAIEDSLAVLRTFHRLGVRYMTLTHAAQTSWAGSSGDDGPKRGLNNFGREVVREMNRIGMLVDVSHVSDLTMSDVLETSRVPVIASHSSARAVCDVGRNIPDELLRRIGTNGGVVMVNFNNSFLDPEFKAAYAMYTPRLLPIWDRFDHDHRRKSAAVRAALADAKLPVVPLSRLVDHIDHIVKVAGIDHVGFGSDFDGITRAPQGIEDVSGFPHITEELLRRGYRDEDVRKILGENFLRVLEVAERFARESGGPISGNAPAKQPASR